MMLKITRVVLSKHEIIMQLDGRLTGQWVELLRDNAELALEEEIELTLDLEQVCFIDCEGVALIKRLIDRGVRPVKVPLFVVEQLRKCEALQGD
jgi:anti-anti-sigma regulatory factor